MRVILLLWALAATAMGVRVRVPLRGGEHDKLLSESHVATLAKVLLGKPLEHGAGLHVGDVSCGACSDAVGAAATLVRDGVLTTERLSMLLTDACIAGDLTTERVCRGGVRTWVPWAVEVLGTDGVTGRGFCVNSGICEIELPLYTNAVVKFASAKPAPPSPRPAPTPGASKKRILQLTDIHYDPMYVVGTNSDCGEPLCCRADNGIPANASLAAGKFGAYICDTNKALLHAAMEYAVSLKPDVVIYTGDSPSHAVWEQNETTALEASATIADVFRTYFGTSVPLVMAVGNHESWPVNNFPLGPGRLSWLYDALASDWSTWLDGEQTTTVRRGGYYAADLWDGVRMISINNNDWMELNWRILENRTLADVDGQLQWIVDELQACEDAGKKAFVMGHIPPISGSTLLPWGLAFAQIVERYNETIMGTFTGHTHTDEFAVYYDLASWTQPQSVAYVAPSVTTRADKNPAMRIYEVDEATAIIVDHVTHHMLLPEANAAGVANFHEFYRASTAYDLPTLEPIGWANLAGSFIRNQSAADTYQRLYKGGLPYDPCGFACAQDLLYEIQLQKMDIVGAYRDARKAIAEK